MPTHQPSTEHSPPRPTSAASALELEHVRVVHEDAVTERIDPRITPAERATDAELDEPYLRQLADYVHHREHEHSHDRHSLRSHASRHSTHREHSAHGHTRDATAVDPDAAPPTKEASDDTPPYAPAVHAPHAAVGLEARAMNSKDDDEGSPLYASAAPPPDSAPAHAPASPGHTRDDTAVDLEAGAPPKDDDDSGPLYVEFLPADARDPAHFSPARKWLITLCAVFFTALAAANGATYNLGFPGMVRDLGCTEFEATVGLSLYTLGFALTPLVTASFSEEFGRQPLYVVSAVGFGMMHLMVALATNIHTVQAARFLAGAFGSTGSTMVGGSIADLFAPPQRGRPMALFALAAIGCTGLGPVAAGWIEMDKRLGWRWIQWIHFIVTMVFAALIPFLMKETRAAVVLTRIARRLRKETGDARYRARVEDERARLRTLVWISCTRPVYLLVTEPVVAAFSVWVGFAWGILYVLIESIGPIFADLHGFNNGEVGVVFVTFFIGSCLGLAAQQYQERLYRKNHAARGPEARLYMAMPAGLVFAGALFIYAWCSFAHVHWIALCIAIVLVEAGSFTIYLAVFTYLADCYGTFASSALAGQSLARNACGTAFPLFTAQMYGALTYHWANTLFALLALVMSPVPFILFWKGPALRARSRFAVANQAKEG
ncbi:MFS general substrate transporter [Phanerochaete sordida]|uniref:MFS general substrate transporter n=1 Tax=Phanerochaete sordida TaxID=48140 RepID=A0A9P3GTB6_9APHY|nr:MFS general substrate transporter [Phanerochaete sordida]